MPRRRSMPSGIDLASLAALFKEQGTLSVKDALAIIHETQDLMNEEPNMVRVEGATIYVFGDIHGQFYDLLALVESVGLDKLAHTDLRMVFLGDYVDRGAFSCEVMLYLLLLKLRFPSKVVLLRGNHECETISSFYGFRNECRVKYGLSVYYHFVSCFQSMPIAALLHTPRGDLFCVHGGLSPDIVTLDDIEAIERRREVPIEGPLCDLLWADPVVDHQDAGISDAQWTSNEVRGCSFYFNAPALFGFLERNALLGVIRAHEYEEAGYMYHFGTDNYDALDKRSDRSVPPLITVFSAANYCDTNGNKAGFLIIHSAPFRLEAKQVEPVSHPMPGLVSVERSTDIWRQFRQTLPFLPASKDFFEDVLRLSGQARKRSNAGFQASPVVSSPSLLQDDSAGDVEKEPFEDPKEATRRRTSEMHPQALRRVLDEEATKWMQSDEPGEDIVVYPSTEACTTDQSAAKTSNAHYRSKLLAPVEVELMKLIFSLLDMDGSMTLTAAEVSQFVFNILGERIPPEVADVYLDALDFDRNGIVDFGDILSWGAVMKANHDRQNASAISVSWIMRRGMRLIRKVDPYRGFLWLTVAFIVRDVVILKRTRFLRSKSLVAFISVALALYAMDVARIRRDLRLTKWCELFPLWQLIARWRRSNVKSDDEECQ